MTRVAWFATLLAAVGCATSHADTRAGEAPSIASLSELSIDALRARRYGSTIEVEKIVPVQGYRSFLASYDSEGLRVYTRIDLPGHEPPANGYPVVVFIHGWRGIDAAPSLEFYYAEDSYYFDMVNAYRDAGFAVLVPGWRGHGTVDGVPAEGIQYMAAWDNGSYLSPVFYALDVMNLLDGLGTFDEGPLDESRINLVGHSQGGSVTLTVLAAAGEEAGLKTPINAASIWNGAIAPRLVQLETYEPMLTSADAFVSGDGSWNATAIGKDGSANPRFVFGWPSDWIGAPDPSDWSWQRDTWSKSVPQALDKKLDEMYATLNRYVGDINDARYRLQVTDGGQVRVEHDPQVAAAVAATDAWRRPSLIATPLALQFSDRDLYSLPVWNTVLCDSINRAGGHCEQYEYAGNTHTLRLSEHGWFSGPKHREGFDRAIARDVRLFQRARSAR